MDSEAVAPPSWTLFLDESGNAGPNYLDHEQPFHIEGGLLVPDASMATTRALLASSFAKLPGQEVKAARLLKTKWASLLAEALEATLQIDGVRVIFAVAERRYSLAGRVVETLLHPDTNPASAFLPWWSVDVREAAWEAVSWLDDEALQEFAAAFRVLDATALARAAYTLASSMERHGLYELAEACRSSVLHLDEIMRVESHWIVQGFEAGQVHALNVPMCMHAAKLADRMLDAKSEPETFRLIHDRVDWFKDAFVQASTVLGGDIGMPLELSRMSGPSVRMGLRRLHSCDMADSKAEQCLQMADLVASAVSRVLRACAQRRLELSPGERAIAKLTIPLLYEPMNPHATIIAASATKARINEELERAGLI